MSRLRVLEVHLPVPGLTLILVSDGRVAVEPSVFNFEPEFHYGLNGVVNVFGKDGYSLSAEDGTLEAFDYGTAYPYKEIPTLKRWLIDQELQLN